MSAFTSLKRITAVCGAAAALTAGSLALSAPAQALSTNDLNNITIQNPQATYRDGDVITISQSGLQAGVTYKVGQCLFKTNWMRIPHCASFVEVTADAQGKITSQVPLVASAQDVHHKITWKGNVNYSSPNSTEIVTIAPHSTGYTGKQAGDSQARFNVVK